MIDLVSTVGLNIGKTATPKINIKRGFELEDKMG
jgi:hypothetical protein